MRSLRWGMAVAGVLLVAAAWWWLARQAGRPGVAGRIAELSASGSVFTVAQRCAGHARGERDFSVWWKELTAAAARAPGDDGEPGQAIDELELDPEAAWRRKGWKLDDESWAVEGAYLARRASRLEAVRAVMHTVVDYERIDACSLTEGLAPPEWHSPLDFAGLFLGAKALGFSAIQAARSGDLGLAQRDLEASLALVEHLGAPVSTTVFLAWGACLTRGLGELEGLLPLLVGRLDLDALERRLAAFAPRELLAQSLEWERAYGLGDIDWFAGQTGATSFQGVTLLPLGVDVDADLELLLEGYDLGLRYVRAKGVADEDLERFHGRLGARTPFSAMLLPRFQDVERVARTAEAELALARTALRLVQHGRPGWESVPRERDPRTGAPLAAAALDSTRVRLSAADPGLAGGHGLEWVVVLR